MTTIADHLPRGQLEAIKGSVQLPGAKKGGAVSGILNHLGAIIRNRKRPSEGWFACIQKAFTVASESSGSASRILKGLESAIWQGFLAPTREALSSGLIAETVRGDLKAIIGFNGKLQPAVINEARALLNSIEQTTQSGLAEPAGQLMTFRPEKTIRFSSTINDQKRGARQGVKIEIQPVEVWGGNGRSQRRIKINAADPNNTDYTVWAVQENGGLHMLHDGKGLVGVTRANVAEVTMAIITAVLNPAPVKPTTPPAATPPANGNGNGRWQGLSDFEVVYEGLGSAKDLTVALDGLTITRQRVVGREGQRQIRLRFQNKDGGYTIVCVSENGGIYIFPRGRVYLKNYERLVCNALKALRAKSSK